jgi:metal-responsive CopG/Arc/MetJ family transcriptional regulator
MFTIPDDLVQRMDEVTKEFGYTKSVQVQTLLRRYLASEFDIKKERGQRVNDVYKA